MVRHDQAWQATTVQFYGQLYACVWQNLEPFLGASTTLELQRLGFTRLLVAGQVVRLDAQSSLPEAETPFEVLVDRLVVQADRRARLLDSLEQALRFGQGMVVVHFGATASAQGRAPVKLGALCPRSGRGESHGRNH